MIKVLERAIERVRALPKKEQELAAQMLESIAGDDSEVYELTEEEHQLLDEALASVERGEFASEADVEAAFAKYRK